MGGAPCVRLIEKLRPARKPSSVVWNMKGGMSRQLDALPSLFSLKPDVCCLVETWLTEHDTSLHFHVSLYVDL